MVREKKREKKKVGPRDVIALINSNLRIIKLASRAPLSTVKRRALFTSAPFSHKMGCTRRNNVAGIGVCCHEPKTACRPLADHRGRTST